MTPEELQQKAIAQATDKLVTGLDKLMQIAPIGDAVTITATELDRHLCEALGNDGASRWWCTFVADTCGREALKTVERRQQREGPCLSLGKNPIGPARQSLFIANKSPKPVEPCR